MTDSWRQQQREEWIRSGILRVAGGEFYVMTVRYLHQKQATLEKER